MISMVSEKKIQTVKDVKEQLKEYPVIGILDMFKLPGRQLHEIKEKLRNDAKIRMVKKRLIRLILRDSELKNISNLDKYVQGEPALIFSKINPFRLARVIEKSKSESPAKPGDIAPTDIIVKAGPTSLPPGPVIGELQRVKIPASVEGEKITIKQDTVVAKEGDVIDKGLADVLSKLGIRPMEIGLNLLAAWEDGLVYSKETLFVPEDEYINQIKRACSDAFNLSVNINYFTSVNIKILLSKAYNEARSLSESAGLVTPDTIGALLAKADAQAKIILEKL